jgi:hypothetical protein
MAPPPTMHPLRFQDEPAFRLLFPHVLAGLVTIGSGPLNSVECPILPAPSPLKITKRQ